MTATQLEPFFLDGAAGRIFLLFRSAAKAQRCVLFIPPFAEEMNKCRRQFTETTHALVESGFAVLVLDLFGTGDSEGEFSEARWETWKSDVSAALDWIELTGLAPYALIAARLGCALAAESLEEAEKAVDRSVFWQPVANGRQFMTQFLRLRVAASMMEGGSKETVEALRKRLDHGEILSVAGYELSPELRQSIENVDLSACMSKNLGDVKILEVSTTGSGELSMAGKQLATAAEGFGVEIAGERLVGEPFWSTTEIVVSHELRKLTVNFLEAGAT